MTDRPTDADDMTAEEWDALAARVAGEPMWPRLADSGLVVLEAEPDPPRYDRDGPYL